MEVLVMKMEEDDGGKIATGAQRRGSKQGEALTSACLTFERDRGTDGRQDRQRGRRAQGKAKA